MKKLKEFRASQKPSSAVAIVTVACIAAVACAAFVWMALTSAAWWRNPIDEKGA